MQLGHIPTEVLHTWTAKVSLIVLCLLVVEACTRVSSVVKVLETELYPSFLPKDLPSL